MERDPGYTKYAIIRFLQLSDESVGCLVLGSDDLFNGMEEELSKPNISMCVAWVGETIKHLQMDPKSTKMFLMAENQRDVSFEGLGWGTDSGNLITKQGPN